VNRHIAIIGAPLDLGAGRRGVDMGPSAVRVAGIGRKLGALGYHVSDLGNIPVAQPEAVEDAGSSQARFLPQIATSCESLA
jgi:arginase